MVSAQALLALAVIRHALSLQLSETEDKTPRGHEIIWEEENKCQEPCAWGGEQRYRQGCLHRNPRAATAALLRKLGNGHP